MKRRSGFTLVELLTVIAIISVLVAILLPVAQKFRRRAMVLACPIAYVGEDQWLHLTDPSGSMDLPLIRVAFSAVGHATAWSPSGQRIGFEYMELPFQGPDSFGAGTIDPMSGSVKKHNTQNARMSFMCWADSNDILQRTGVTMKNGYYETCQLRNAESSDILQVLNPPDSSVRAVSLLPPSLGNTRYVTVEKLNYGNGSYVIALRRKDFSLARVIWQEDSMTRWVAYWDARVDPMGEYVAWTRSDGGSTGGGPRIAVKSLKDPASMQPTMLGDQFQYASFCDWTEDGNMLVNVTENGVCTLGIMDRYGTLRRKIPTAVTPGAASWRKYGHQ